MQCFCRCVAAAISRCFNDQFDETCSRRVAVLGLFDQLGPYTRFKGTLAQLCGLQCRQLCLELLNGERLVVST